MNCLKRIPFPTKRTGVFVANEVNHCERYAVYAWHALINTEFLYCLSLNEMGMRHLFGAYSDGNLERGSYLEAI